MGQGVAEAFKDLTAKRVNLELKLEENLRAMEKLASNLELADVVNMYSNLQLHTVWRRGGISAVLLVNRCGKFANCGILLWGSQLPFNPGCLAIRVNEFVARFMVFDAAPSSESVAGIISKHGGCQEMSSFVRGLKEVCEKVGISFIYAKNANLLETGGTLWCMTKEIENLYMQIARSDGSLIPQFDFIEPQQSSAFWRWNG